MNSALQDPALRLRVDELLAHMTIDQKIGQMIQTERLSVTPEEVKQYHLGSVLSGGGSCPDPNRPRAWVEMTDAYWAASMESDAQHLAIPIIYGVDAIHGNNNVLGATVFPHNIGLGMANDPDLLAQIAKVTAREILATGVDWSFAPTLAVAQNLHWGRTYESYSENPAIVESYAAGFVSALQSDLGRDGVVACVKHWVGDGGTTHGIDQGETTVSPEVLESIHVRPYYPALEAGVLTVMVSFNSWNGDKCHGHHHLLTELLKNRLGFDGFVISDWDGVDYLCDDYAEAIGIALNAGMDMFMVSVKWRELLEHIKAHAQNGTVPLARIDDAVRRILAVKFACGLFDKPRPRERYWSNHPSFGCMEHRELARDAVRKSLVMLKNERNVLPLKRSTRILVAGKNAHNRGHQCGGFTVAWQGVNGNDFIEGGTSIWEGIQKANGNATLSTHPTAADVDPTHYDVAVVVVGETPYAEGLGDIRSGDDIIVEAGSQIRGSMKVLAPYGSSLELARLHPEDLQLLQSLHDKGIPLVVVLVSGRPLVVNLELALADAFVAAWLPGSEGQGVADVLFGDHDFRGRLSFSWPGSAEPASCSSTLLFPRGFGLTYG